MNKPFLPPDFTSMLERPKKRSIAPKGHRTSISLEEPFWQAFCDIAQQRRASINALIEDIDEARGQTCGLASAVRIYVLEEMRARCSNQSDRAD